MCNFVDDLATNLDKNLESLKVSINWKTENYHTHTFRCQHASGDVEDYCKAALEQGLTLLGMSDHTPLPDDRWPLVRMSLAQLPDYCAAIDAAREKFPQLRILKGMECEYDAAYVNFYRDELCGRLGFEYLIGAVHYLPWQGGWEGMYKGTWNAAQLHAYADYMIDTLRSGLFAFIAHPDAFGVAYLSWDNEAEACSRAILQVAQELNIPLEINAYGLRKPSIETPQGERKKYPLLPFWVLAAEYELEVVVNADAHRPQDVTVKMDEAATIAESNGLRFAAMRERLIAQS